MSSVNPWPQIAERIVGERGQMNHGIDAGKIARRRIARVLADRRHFGNLATGRKCAARIEVAIKAYDLMSGLKQHRRHNCADVAQMSRQQYAHCHCS